jgi:hypothetical protein
MSGCDHGLDPGGFTESFEFSDYHHRMYMRLDRPRRTIPVILGIAALADVVVLLAWDAFPKLFPARAHALLAAFSLATIAFAYLIYEAAHRPSLMSLMKAILLALAFLSWAANQFWPALPLSSLFNDIAIGLFVLDVFLVMVGWPPSTVDGAFAETGEVQSIGKR